MSFDLRIKQSLEQKLPSSWQQETPGFCLRAFVGGKLRSEIHWGRTYPVYDLASLTKILFATTYFMHLCSFEPNLVNWRVQEILPWWKLPRHRVRHFFTHTAGLPWWCPLYDQLSGPRNPISRWEQMPVVLYELKASQRKKSVYSDPDFWVLGILMQELEQRGLESIFLDLREHLNLEGLHFNPKSQARYRVGMYAPTGFCPVRRKQIRCEVHDANTWALGGVSTHAGLFGDLRTVGEWLLWLRRIYRGQQGDYVQPEVLRSFTRRSLPIHLGDWGLGFMLPTQGSASCGSFFSANSFGHTGFTGTSIWYDPLKDLGIVLLSNRTESGFERKGFSRQIRPMIHDIVANELLRG